MSLFQRAASLLREAMGSDNSEVGDLAAELDAAHLSAAATMPGPGRRVVISSGSGDGYLVEIHDGTRFYAYGIKAGSEAEALAEAQQRFSLEPVEESPIVQDPPAPDPQMIAPPAPPTHELPNASDPQAVDVTRGRDTEPAAAPIVDGGPHGE